MRTLSGILKFFSAITFESQRLTEGIPRLTRVTAYGTVMFEVASLVNQCFGSHPAFCSFTMLLILTSHRWVQGRDSDMIAKDMFCKCYFAAM